MNIGLTHKPFGVLTLLLGSTVAFASTDAGKTKANQPDNTRANQSQYTTAEDQVKGTDRDVELTRMIRSELSKDGSLSTYAINIKIITLKGTATLTGPVRSMEESDRIASFAEKVVGQGNVRNQLKVTPAN